MYRLLSKFFPKKLKEKYEKLLVYSNINLNLDRFIGFLLFSGIGLALFFSFILSKIINLPVILIFVPIFLLIEVLAYVLLMLSADKKGRFIENILPDALQLMSSNLKAGLTTDKALLLSARPEFGPFSEEINTIGKEITMGKEIEQSLIDMSKRIRSEKLEKTVLLIVSGLKAGGELSALLDQTAANLRQQRFVEERVRTNVLMYVIFIFFAIGFGAPMLFGLSSFLVEVLTKTLSTVEVPETATAVLPITIGKIAITPNFILIFTVVSLITSSTLGALVLGLIRKGKERAGVRFIPILIALSLGIFFLVRFIIKNAFGSLFGI